MDHTHLLRIFSQIPLVNRLSLRTKLVLSFLFVVIAGGLLSSLIGTELVADTIISQARNKTRYDLSIAEMAHVNGFFRATRRTQPTAFAQYIAYPNSRRRPADRLWQKHSRLFGVGPFEEIGRVSD
jgi:hypothetical protein